MFTKALQGSGIEQMENNLTSADPLSYTPNMEVYPCECFKPRTGTMKLFHYNH